MPLRVIACRVGVNIGIATMNRDIISGDGDTVLVASFAGGSDLDRLVFWRLDINGAAPGSRKEKQKKDGCPRSHGAPRRYRRAKVLQGEKVRAGLAFTYSPEKQGNHVCAESARQFVG